MLKNIIATAFLSTLVSSALAAQPETFYAGLDGGNTKVTDSGDGTEFPGQKGSYGAFLGYNFHQNFAVEVEARHLGNWDLGGVAIHVKQYSASVVGTLPLQSDFYLLGRIGYSRLEAGATHQGAHISFSDNGALFGVGVGYNFTPAISSRIEFQKPSRDSRNLGVSVAYQF